MSTDASIFRRVFGSATRVLVTTVMIPGAILLTIILSIHLPRWLDEFRASKTAPVVFLDNYSGQALRIDLDGDPWQTRPDQTSEKVTMPPGEHTLVVYAADGGKELDRLVVSTENGKKYVFNALAAQVYISREVYYTTSGPGYAPRDPKIIRDKWFEGTETYVLEEPPKTITVTKGTTTERKTCLLRLSPEERKQFEARKDHQETEADLKEIGRAYERGFGPTRVGRTGPTPPQGPDNLTMAAPLRHPDRYTIVWGHAGAFGKAEPSRRLAWEKAARADGKRFVLMGDFRTVRLMDAAELDRTLQVSSER